MERTEHSQTTAPPSAKALETLLAIAERLTARRPSACIDDARRHALALTYATDAYGYLSDASLALERELLALMPPIAHRSPITRGEYALQLRRAAAGGAQ